MSSEVSVELVPRSLAGLKSDIEMLRSVCPSVNTLNIPDLLRLSTRSWDACAIGVESGFNAIPHLRAMDFCLDEVDTLIGLLHDRGLDRVLIVQGDPPSDLSHPVHGTTSLELIRSLKAVAPDLTIYAGFDPYRKALQQELKEAQAKCDAGAAGLFTQPIFDLRLADMCADQLQDKQVFWGVSPVVSEGSKSYWEKRNNVFFPKDFELNLDWHRDFAKMVLNWASRRDASVYFMPIRVDLKSYLEGIFVS